MNTPSNPPAPVDGAAAADMQPSENYPILEQRFLRPREGKLFLRARRSHELPSMRGASAMVLFDGRNYKSYSYMPSMRDKNVFRAVTAWIVDLSAKLIEVDLEISSATAAEDFQLQVTFVCRVNDPAAVIERGPVGIATLANVYFHQDHGLLSLGLDYDPIDFEDFRTLASARVDALFSLQPLRVPGMLVSVGKVTVPTPLSVRAHSKRMQDTRSDQIIAQEKSDFDLRQAERIEQLINRSPAALAAFGLQQGEVTVGTLLEQTNPTGNLSETGLRLPRLVQLIDILDRNGFISEALSDETVATIAALAQIDRFETGGKVHAFKKELS